MKEKIPEFGLLWLRVLPGLGLMYHGWMKLLNGVDLFAKNAVAPLGLPVPIVFAWLSVAAELVGGFFLVLGLWTRIAAAAIVINMAVAAFGAHAAHPFISAGGPSKELALCYLVMAVAVLLLGPGSVSVDATRGTGRAFAKRSRK